MSTSPRIPPSSVFKVEADDIEVILYLCHTGFVADRPPKTEVIATDEFVSWWNALPEKEHDAVRDSVDLLEQFGINLPFPHSSAIEGTKFRELRRKSGKHQLRSVYIFDQFRQAVLLLGGDKLGIKKALFYPKIIDQAERIWKQYLQEQKGTS